MINQPFFSVVIPTYNRAKYLKAAISSILQQTFQDFELIVSNNCSTDNTQKIVNIFKDKRIKYFVNKKNIGAEANMKKVVSYARGKYIFTIGDDDLILFENTLEDVKKAIDKKHYGFIRINLIEKKFIGDGLRKSIIAEENNIEIKKNSSSEKIIDFFWQTASAHFAGLIIKNYPNLSDDFLNLPEMALVKILYKNTIKFGALYLANHYMIITWSQGEILNHYVPKNNRLMFEDYTDFVFSIIPKNKISNYKLKYYRKFIMLQPVIKLYSGNPGLITFDKKLLCLEPRLKENMFFWLFFSISIIVPKPFWRLVRVIQHRSKNTLEDLDNKDKIYKQFNYLSKINYST